MTEGSLESPRGAHRCGSVLLGPLHGRTGRACGSRLSQVGVPPSGLRQGAGEEWREGHGSDRWQGSGAGASEGCPIPPVLQERNKKQLRSIFF